MSIQAVAAVLEADVGEVAAKMLLVCLANAHNTSTELCAPSISRLEAESGMARSTVKKWLGWLVDEQLIEVETRYDETGRQMSNVYRLTFMGRGRNSAPGGQSSAPTEGPNCGPSPNSAPAEGSAPRGVELSAPSKESTVRKPEKGARARTDAHGADAGLALEGRAGSGKGSAPMTGPDGQPYLSFKVADNATFVAACLAEWDRDGKSRSYLLQAKSVSIPVAVVERTRENLEVRRPDSPAGGG